jgi:hypothetical protein
MHYHVPTKQFTVEHSKLELAGYSLIYAIRHIRDMAGLPYTKYQRDGMLTDADHAQKGILDAAKSLGVDLGAEWGNELDVSESP